MKRIILKESSLHKLLGNFLLEDNEKNEVIEPTVAWVKQKYNEFNEKYFDNFLPKCSISVRPLGEKGGYVLGGTFRFMNAKNALVGLGVNLVYNEDTGGYDEINKDTIYKVLKPVITINSKYSAPAKVLENTIIHEMCHYYTYFDKDGNFRNCDKENEHHGNDFLEAAKMISEKSNGEINIKRLLEAEEIEQLSASSYFEKGGYKICTTKYKGMDIFWYTKIPSIWIKFAYGMLSTDTINVTSDSQVLMLLKRYRYSQTTLRSKKLNAYDLSTVPNALIDAFNKAKFVEVKKEDFDKFFGDDD